VFAFGAAEYVLCEFGEIPVIDTQSAQEPTLPAITSGKSVSSEYRGQSSQSASINNNVLQGSRTCSSTTFDDILA